MAKMHTQQSMALPAGAGEPPAGGEPVAGNPADGNAPAASPESVTVAMLEQALSKVNSDLRASIGRELKTLREELGGVKPSNPQAPEESTPTDRTLKERLALLEERDSKAQKKALRMAIREALREAGADPALAEVAVPAILEQEGERFKVQENRLGDYEAFYQEESVADWAKVFMQGALGKRLTNGAAAPSLGLPSSNAGPAGGKRRVPYSQVKHCTKEELESGKIELVEG